MSLTRHKYKDDMKKFLLIIGISFITVCGVLAQIDTTLESALKYNEWHKVDTEDEFGDISGSYDVFIELADCTDVNEKDIKIVARLSRTQRKRPYVNLLVGHKEKYTFMIFHMPYFLQLR